MDRKLIPGFWSSELIEGFAEPGTQPKKLHISLNTHSPDRDGRKALTLNSAC